MTPSAAPTRRRFAIARDRSAVLCSARSNAGPVAFGTTELSGTIEVTLGDGSIDFSDPPTARLEVAMATLSSGNSLYDVELQRRIDVRLFPTTVVELVSAEPMGDGRARLRGEVTFHGVTREMAGTVAVSFPTPETLHIEGEHPLDIRDFDIVVPAMLMLRIYPDVRVHLQVEADAAQ